MLIYSEVLDRHSDVFVIQYLRQNKWLWDYRMFFDALTPKQTATLLKSLIRNRDKVIFTCVEGQSWSLKYWRPYKLAKVILAHFYQPNAIFYDMFFDVVCENESGKYNYRNKLGAERIEKVCFISSNYPKIVGLQKSYRPMYSELDIYGEYHRPITRVSSDRSGDSISTCAKYMAALCVENNDEEGYFQGSALWALFALTPPILKAPPKWKNFIRADFAIDFFDYQTMNKQQRVRSILAVQDRLMSGDTFLTTLSQDYIAFFKKSFAPDVEPAFESIVKESQAFRAKFINV